MWACKRGRVEHSWFFSTVMVNFTLVIQIAAKIGGDAGPPLNNSTPSDGFPFTAQKRQLEDAGMVAAAPWSTVAQLRMYLISMLLWSKQFAFRCKRYSVLTNTSYGHPVTVDIGRFFTLQMNQRARKWLHRVTWIPPKHCVSSSCYFMLSILFLITHSWQYLI